MKAGDPYLQGVGRLNFKAFSPSGLGRQVLIPFYLADPMGGYGVLSDAGVVASSMESPTIRITAPAANGATSTAFLRTPQISWAVLRLVGFSTNIYYPPIANQGIMDISFSDLKVGGGNSLFVHEDFGSGSMYQSSITNPGLRDYPIVLSPNFVEVSVQALGLTTSNPILFSCAIIADILYDDEYGAHIPGPYARRGAMLKKPLKKTKRFRRRRRRKK